MGKNRQQARKPKLGKFWCGSCDSAYLAKGQKCPVCGNLEQKRRKR